MEYPTNFGPRLRTCQNEETFLAGKDSMRRIVLPEKMNKYESKKERNEQQVGKKSWAMLVRGGGAVEGVYWK